MGSPIRENVCSQIPTEILLISVNIECWGGNLNVPCSKLINSRMTSVIRLPKKPKSMTAVLTMIFMKHYAISFCIFFLQSSGIPHMRESPYVSFIKLGLLFVLGVGDEGVKEKLTRHLSWRTHFPEGDRRRQ